uniref:CWH43-like N-terminal domain-containing protein n=1 Tax=Romanomermis culicivorax TaxID=13658 RepID=A0A915J969_ROMCU
MISISLWDAKVGVFIFLSISSALTAKLIGLSISYALHYDEMLANGTGCETNDVLTLTPISHVAGLYPEKFLLGMSHFICGSLNLFWAWAYSYFYKHCRAYHNRGAWYRLFCCFIKLNGAMVPLNLFIVFNIGIEDHFPAHASAFTGFLVAFNCGMISNVSLQYASGFYKVSRKTFLWKCGLIPLNLAMSFGMLASFTLYKNEGCSLAAYQIFSITEYFIISFAGIYHLIGNKELKNFHLKLAAVFPGIDSMLSSMKNQHKTVMNQENDVVREQLAKIKEQKYLSTANLQKFVKFMFGLEKSFRSSGAILYLKSL